MNLEREIEAMDRRIEGATREIQHAVHAILKEEQQQKSRRIERLERQIDRIHSMGQTIAERAKDWWKEREETQDEERKEYLRGYAQALQDVGAELQRL